MTFVNLECIPKENIQGENKSKEYLFRCLSEWTEIIAKSSIEQVFKNNTHYIDAQLRLRFDEMVISTAEASRFPFSQVPARTKASTTTAL